MHKEITFDRFVRGLIFLLVTGALIFVIGFLSPVLVPFFVAWFIAYLIFPIVHFIQFRLHLRNRVLSILATLALIIGIVYGLVALTWPSVTHEVDLFKEQVVRISQDGTINKSIPIEVQRFVKRNLSHLNIEKWISQKDMVQLAKEVVPQVWHVIYQTANIILTVVGSLIGLLYMFFILYDFEKLYRGIVNMVPSRHRGFMNTLFDDLSHGMNRYFRGQALISLCVGILFSVGFLLIGFPLAIPLGILVGVLSLVPYMHALGIIPIVLLSIMKAATTGENFWLILIMALLVFLCVQIIEDTVLTPNIMGKAVGMPPFLILLALSVWGYLLGIIGMIIALPLTTLIISYYKRYVLKETPPILPATETESTKSEESTKKE